MLVFLTLSLPDSKYNLYLLLDEKINRSNWHWVKGNASDAGAWDPDYCIDQHTRPFSGVVCYSSLLSSTPSASVRRPLPGNSLCFPHNVH